MVTFPEFISCVAQLNKTVFWVCYQAPEHTTDVTVTASIDTLPGYCQSIFAPLPVTWIKGKLKLNWSISCCRRRYCCCYECHLTPTRCSPSNLPKLACKNKRKVARVGERRSDNDCKTRQQIEDGKEGKKNRDSHLRVNEMEAPLSRK